MDSTYYINKFYKLPFTLLFLVTTLCLIGFLVLISMSDGHIMPWAYLHMKRFCMFLPIAIFIAFIDLKLIFRFAYLFYAIALLLLVGVEFFGHIAMGAKRWIDLGLIKLQPSEPIKLAMILMLSKYFHQLHFNQLNNPIRFLLPIICVMIPAILIIKQPDLGTSIIIIITAGVILFAAGVSIWYFICLISIFVSALPIIWHFMHDYQKQRVLVFLDPTLDPLNAGYNVIQSKIAIGSGGLFGKGIMQGTQSHLDFLPEHQTDFIFSSLAEEFGFIGSLTLLSLYSFVILLCIIIAVNCKNIFGKLLAIGVTSVFFFHTFINIAMTCGALPVVGIPLPFLSYGGSMMAMTLISFGLIMNVHINRHRNI